MKDEAGLTDREWETLVWVAEGKSNAEIAVILNCKVGTVIKHLYRAYRKIGVENRTSAAIWMREQQALGPAGPAK